MKISQIFNILTCFILLTAFIGISVTKGYCSMDFCKKECMEKCCKESDQGCKSTTEYLQLESEFSQPASSIKIQEFYLFLITNIHYFENSLAVLTSKHSEFSYINPQIPIDIPIAVRCFRI